MTVARFFACLLYISKVCSCSPLFPTAKYQHTGIPAWLGSHNKASIPAHPYIALFAPHNRLVVLTFIVYAFLLLHYDPLSHSVTCDMRYVASSLVSRSALKRVRSLCSSRRGKPYLVVCAIATARSYRLPSFQISNSCFHFVWRTFSLCVCPSSVPRLSSAASFMFGIVELWIRCVRIAHIENWNSSNEIITIVVKIIYWTKCTQLLFERLRDMQTWGAAHCIRDIGWESKGEWAILGKSGRFDARPGNFRTPSRQEFMEIFPCYANDDT